jgi:hypothetical protein
MTDNTPSLEQLLGLDADDSGSTPAGSDGKGLREQLRAVLAENKQLKEQTALVAQRERVRTVAELVTKHSIPPLAQDLLLREIGDTDPTDEAVTGFVAKYGELWGAKAAEASTTPEQQAQTAQVQALSATGHETPAQLLSEEAYRSRFAEAKTAEDVMRLTAEAAGGFEVAL